MYFYSAAVPRRLGGFIGGKKNGSHKRFRSAVNGWDLTILTDNFCVGGVGKKLGGFISCYMGYGLRDGVSKISLNLLI